MDLTSNFFTCNFTHSDYKNGIFSTKKNNKIKFQIIYWPYQIEIFIWAKWVLDLEKFFCSYFFFWQHSLDNTSGPPRRWVTDSDRIPLCSSIDLSIRNEHSFWWGFFFKVHLTRMIINAIHTYRRNT